MVSCSFLSTTLHDTAYDDKNTVPTDLSSISAVESEAPGIVERKSVHEPVETGILTIDSMIPVGRGQRELILGDRQTGKTAIATDVIIHQANIIAGYTGDDAHKRGGDKFLYCVYTAIGQKQSSIMRVISKLRQYNAVKHCVVIATTAASPAAMQAVAPYTASAYGEYFRDNGMHSLVVYDDLSKHATAHRQMGLILRRAPGREAYPGDVFYAHSRLLERAAKLSDRLGAGSMTALPIVETQFGDVSSYIPTNVISITDGQIFLDSELFNRGLMPAINVGLSVSRVGSAAQPGAFKAVAGGLKGVVSQFRDLERMAVVGSTDETTRFRIARGRRLLELLKQPEATNFDAGVEALLLFACNQGYFDAFGGLYTRACKDFIVTLGTGGPDTACHNLYSLLEITEDTADNYNVGMYNKEANEFAEYAVATYEYMVSNAPAYYRRLM